MNKDSRALRRFIAEAMGIHVASLPSGNSAFPTRERLHTHDGTPVAHPGGGFFGHGWVEREEGAWFDCPDFPGDERAAFLALEWLRSAHDILLRIMPYSTVSASGGYRVGVFLAYPHLEEDDYTTGPTAALAIAKAIMTALQLRAATGASHA